MLWSARSMAEEKCLVGSRMMSLEDCRSFMKLTKSSLDIPLSPSPGPFITAVGLCVCVCVWGGGGGGGGDISCYAMNCGGKTIPEPYADRWFD